MRYETRKVKRLQLDAETLRVRESARGYDASSGDLSASSEVGLPGVSVGRSWIREIREALGISLEVLAKRLGVSRQTAGQLETAEAAGTITVNRLRTACEALDCDLLIAVVPRQPLEDVVQQRAMRVARDQVSRVNHSLRLEDQGLTEAQFEWLVSDTAEKLIRANDPRLWEL